MSKTVSENELVRKQVEEQLLSKEAVALPPKERLQLLLNAKNYPIAKKRMSAEKQIKEMIDLFDFYSMMLLCYFPNKEEEANYLILALLESIVQECQKEFDITDKQLYNKALKFVGSYEMFEEKIEAVQSLFWEYKEAFPELFERYNLEELACMSIMDIIKKACIYRLSYLDDIVKRWNLV